MPGQSTTGISNASALPPLAWRPVGAVLAAVAALLTLLSARYGYHRDELYFLVAGRHLAWGYPDQGPLVPFLWRVASTWGGGSIVVERVPATACALGTALAAVAIARELGGQVVGQVLTAVVVGLSAMVLGAGHLLVTATVDLFVWTTVSCLVVHIIRTGRDRLWLLAGLVAGLGLLNKDLPLVLLLGVGVGIALTTQTRRVLRSRWFWIGGLVAAAIWLPNVLWQHSHGWPQVTLGREIHAEYSQPAQRIGFVVAQLMLYGPVGLFLWVSGATRLWRERSAFRVLPCIWAVSILVFAGTAGQGYYPAGTYPALIAAGAVGLEHQLRRRAQVAALLAAEVVTAAALVPAFLPVLPASALANSAWRGLAGNQLETVGWPALVDQVSAAFHQLPAAQQAVTALYTTNYGEAGALVRYGPADRLPVPHSGHNGFWYWGPPPQGDTTTLAVSEHGPPPLLPHCRRVAAVHNPEGVANEESSGAALYVCGAPSAGWAAAWPQLEHLSS